MPVRSPVPQIPLPTDIIILVDEKKLGAVKRLLTSSSHSRVMIIDLKTPSSSDRVANWILGLKTSVERHIKNGRFNSFRSVALTVTPLFESQARIMSAMRPDARVIYVGPNLNTPTQNPYTRTIIKLTKWLTEYRGHVITLINPELTPAAIVEHILGHPAHAATKLVRTIDSLQMSQIVPVHTAAFAAAV